MRHLADVALILEGTYPYVAGGVSTWVHQILGAYPSRRFALHHIGPHPGAYKEPRYEVPPNVVAIVESYCRGAEVIERRAHGSVDAPPRRRHPSRVLGAIRRLHVDDVVDDQLLEDLDAGDLTIHEFLHGEETFELLRHELYERLSPGAPFMDFFWHFRSMHLPLLRLLGTKCPDAGVYHAVSTGYAGLVGALASRRTKRPLVVTEHGLYAREREMELSRARWIHDLATREPSPLRRFWSHYFRMLSRIAYHQASRLVTLSAANRAKQVADGADPKKTMVVPNGVSWPSPPAAATATPTASTPRADRKTLRIGFVGRVVPIKDVITLIRAIGIARDRIDLEAWIVGPEDEDPTYARRCHALAKALSLDLQLKFMGPQPVAQIYPELDVVVLTSLSEGQPLVILEAYAHGVPVIATDVGACRELIEGGDELDRRLGASGIVTRVANPPATAAALVKMSMHPELRTQMGKAALARVAARYQLRQVVAGYDSLYESMVLPSPA